MRRVALEPHASEKSLFERFLATKEYTTDLPEAIRDECVEGPGMLYMDVLFINHDPSKDKDQWSLLIGRDEYSGELAKLEKMLFRFALDEGYLADWKEDEATRTRCSVWTFVDGACSLVYQGPDVITARLKAKHAVWKDIDGSVLLQIEDKMEVVGDCGEGILDVATFLILDEEESFGLLGQVTGKLGDDYIKGMAGWKIEPETRSILDFTTRIMPRLLGDQKAEVWADAIKFAFATAKGM